MGTRELTIRCDSCGSALREEEIYREDTFSLCATCTRQGRTPPNFETVVCAVAMGYFLVKLKLMDPAEAINQAFD
ncbi:MAG: hypothetical protein ACFFC7_24725, partial [Candidatus Hermodarchaeota archaeon]